MAGNQQPEAQEADEGPESEYPKGIKWYGEWVDARYYLPRGAQMPAEVRLADGSTRIWITVTQDWRPVTAWRRVQVTNGCARRMRKEQNVIWLEEIEA